MMAMLMMGGGHDDAGAPPPQGRWSVKGVCVTLTTAPHTPSVAWQQCSLGAGARGYITVGAECWEIRRAYPSG